jgi:hypothetical protein
MATRQITIDDGSKRRKQVNFDVQPMSLNPTITNGGNYNVFAAPTPKTNQALQLSESLKQLPKLGNQFAKIQQGIGQDRAGLIQGQDAEEELKRLEKEEPETFMNFMRRKAYSDSLIEKHIRTEMVPNTLRGLKKSANARVYGNEKDFNANIDEQLSSSWQSFEQSVGADVANSTEGKTIWNNLTDEMRVQAQSAYFESQDRVALENDIESLEHRISSQLSPTDIEGNARDIDLNFVSDLTKTAIPDLMRKHGMSRGEASTYLRQIMDRRLATLQVEGKNLMVLDLAEAMERTVSKDGVRIYEGDSATALSMARTLAAARKEIEDLEEEENDIDQLSQKEFTGQLLGATRALQNGARFQDLTPNQQLLVLAPIQNANPNFTLEDLQAKMAPQSEGEVGGGLETLESILTDLTVNGTDRAQLLLNATKSSFNHALVTASQIKGAPKAVKSKEQRLNYQERFRNEKMMDPDLSLTQFLKQENITSWGELNQLELKMADVNSVMRSPAYEEVPEKTRIAVKASFATLEESDALGIISTESRDKFIDDFAVQIQKILVEEAESGTLKPEDYVARRDELVKRADKSLMEIMRTTEGTDINFQDTNTPDAEVGTQELTQTVTSMAQPSFAVNPLYGAIVATGLNTPAEGYPVTEELNVPFKTNESKLKEVKTKRDKKAFGVVPLYDTYRKEWSQDEINADRAEMVARMDSESNATPYQNALGYSLYSHGLDIIEDADNAISLMKKAGVDSMDVSLFTDPAEFMVFGDEIYDVYKKVVAVEALTPQDEKLIETAKFLGLMVNGDLNERNFAVRVQKFITVQSQLIKRHVK